MRELPFVESVFHPSDFSPASHTAFAHALAVTLYRQADLTILHVVPEGRAIDVWSDSPQVRETLERWGALEPGSPRSAVAEKLAIRVGKVNVRNSDPLEAILNQIDRRGPDLMVLATEGRHGLPGWFRRSIAATAARQSRTMTLFVPDGCRPFVSMEDGSVTLKRVLIPVDHEPSPRQALVHAARAAVMSHHESVEINLLRVGTHEWPAMAPPELGSVEWNRIERKGDPVKGILAAADEIQADLIVMATSGRNGILDALRGSVTEQVIRRAPCPVLAVPASRSLR